MKLAQKYNLPMRAQTQEIEAILAQNGIRYAPCHIPDFYDHGTVEMLLKLLNRSLKEQRESVEFALHPAYVDQTLLELSSYNIQRAKELATLMDPRVMGFIQEHPIELIHFGNI